MRDEGFAVGAYATLTDARPAGRFDAGLKTLALSLLLLSRP
jgi:hypothetical protein